MIRRRAGALAVAQLLCACGHVPLSTMYRMRSFDPASADPAGVRAAVRIPEVLAPAPAGVKLVVRFGGDGAAASAREAEFVLEEIASARETGPLAAEVEPGTRIHVFRVGAADLERMRAVQAEVREARRGSGARPRGSVTIAADPCRRGALPDGPLLLTTYFRTGEHAGWVPLVEDVDVRELAPRGKDLMEVVPPCEAR